MNRGKGSRTLTQIEEHMKNLPYEEIEKLLTAFENLIAKKDRYMVIEDANKYGIFIHYVRKDIKPEDFIEKELLNGKKLNGGWL